MTSLREFPFQTDLYFLLSVSKAVQKYYKILILNKSFFKILSMCHNSSKIKIHSADKFVSRLRKFD